MRDAHRCSSCPWSGSSALTSRPCTWGCISRSTRCVRTATVSPVAWALPDTRSCVPGSPAGRVVVSGEAVLLPFGLASVRHPVLLVDDFLSMNTCVKLSFMCLSATTTIARPFPLVTSLACHVPARVSAVYSPCSIPEHVWQTLPPSVPSVLGARSSAYSCGCEGCSGVQIPARHSKEDQLLRVHGTEHCVFKRCCDVSTMSRGGNDSGVSLPSFVKFSLYDKTLGRRRFWRLGSGLFAFAECGMPASVPCPLRSRYRDCSELPRRAIHHNLP
jgi:hypothetical protein